MQTVQQTRTMTHYTIEITDTFGGEANYAWVRRYQTTATSMRGAMQKLARYFGGHWRKDYGDNYSARYVVPGACICAFVEEYDPDGWSDLGGVTYASF